MRSLNSIFIVLTATAICSAQMVNIKGTVKDAAGNGISGAIVKLEKALYQTTTGPDGSFTLTDNPIRIAQKEMRIRSMPLSAEILNGILSINVEKKAIVTISTLGLDGKIISTLHPVLEAGIHPISLPTSDLGICLYKVGLEGQEYVLKSLNMGRVAGSSSEFTNNFSFPSLAKRSSSTVGFKDVMAVGKTGYLNNRSSVINPTATGLDIRMIASAGSVKDADGNEYQSVKLGNQVWTVEHLRTTKYNDGTPIPLISEMAAWGARTTAAFCYPNNTTNQDTIKKWGALYNWFTVDTKKLAPVGWHVPNDADWTTIQNYLISAGFNYDGSTSGNKLGKAMASTTDWGASTVAGAVGNDQAKNNKSGFSAMPIGFRDQGGSFTSVGTRAIMSSSNNKEGLYGWFADIDNTSSTIRYSDDYMRMGFAIRLVKD